MSCKIAVGCTEFTIISSFPTSVTELKTIVLSNTKNWIKKIPMIKLLVSVFGQTTGTGCGFIQ